VQGRRLRGAVLKPADEKKKREAPFRPFLAVRKGDETKRKKKKNEDFKKKDRPQTKGSYGTATGGPNIRTKKKKKQKETFAGSEEDHRRRCPRSA